MKTYESTQAEVAAVQEELDKRKRRMILGLVLGLIALSAFLFSGTLAKYVTEGSGSDSARVAKWGVEIEPTGSTSLFESQYATTDGDYSGALSVQAATDVVAPGTGGSIGGFTITGTPEVATNVKVAVDPSSEITGFTLEDDSAYEPVKWTLTKDGATVVNKGTFAQLEAALAAIDVDLAPGTNLGGTNGIDFDIAWEWAFSDGHDVQDTYLGNQDAPPTINLAYTVTATQID